MFFIETDEVEAKKRKEAEATAPSQNNLHFYSDSDSDDSFSDDDCAHSKNSRHVSINIKKLPTSGGGEKLNNGYVKD